MMERQRADLQGLSPLIWTVCQPPLTSLPPLPKPLPPKAEPDGLTDWSALPNDSLPRSNRPQSVGSATLNLKLLALKQRQMEFRRQPSWAGIPAANLSTHRSAYGGWATMPRPNTAHDGEEAGALQRLASSPASLIASSARSFSTPRTSRELRRPMTSRWMVEGRMHSTAPAEHSVATDSSPEEDLQPFGSPAAELQRVLEALNAAKLAERHKVDWQAQLQAVQSARRLVRHHAEHVAPQAHALVWGVAPVIDDLRSFSAKTALAFFQEVFEVLGHALDAEVEPLVPLLLRKAGAVSTGRDNFLASHADRVLACMLVHASPLRFAAALLATAAQKGPKLRCKVAAYLAAVLTSEHGPRLATHPSMPEKLLRAATALLEEGQLETRNHAKRAIAQLQVLLEQYGPPRAFEALTSRISGGTPGSPSREFSNSPPASPTKSRPFFRGVDASMRRSSSLPHFMNVDMG